MVDDFMKNSLPEIHYRRCGQQCLPGNIKLIMQHSNVAWFSVHCHSCGTDNFAMATLHNDEMPEVVTELTESEIAKLSTPIYADDILDMHLFLKDFKGDFSSLFNCEQSAD